MLVLAGVLIVVSIWANEFAAIRLLKQITSFLFGI
jgi:hypothetical protein